MSILKWKTDPRSTSGSGSTSKFNHFQRVTHCPCLPCLVDIRKRIRELSSHRMTDRQTDSKHHITPPWRINECTSVALASAVWFYKITSWQHYPLDKIPRGNPLQSRCSNILKAKLGKLALTILLTLSNPQGSILMLTDPWGVTSRGIFSGGNVSREAYVWLSHCAATPTKISRNWSADLHSSLKVKCSVRWRHSWLPRSINNDVGKFSFSENKYRTH